MNEKGLKHCPFCEERDKLEVHYCDGDCRYYVTCGFCRAKGPTQDNPNMAQRFWNLRI